MKRTLEQRKENSEGQKGSPIEVLQCMSLAEAKKRGFEIVMVPVFGTDQHCRGIDDVEAVMDEMNMDGDFIPVRRPCGILTRHAVIRTEKTESGIPGMPVTAEVVEEDQVQDNDDSGLPEL